MIAMLYTRVGPLLLAALLMLGLPAGAAWAQAQPATEPPPAKVQQLLDLLSDPEVKAWLEKKAPPPEAAATTGTEVADQIETWEAALRGRVSALAAAIPRIPQEFARASDTALKDMDAGRGKVLLIVLALVGVGYAVEYGFRRLLARTRDGTSQPAEAQGVPRLLSMLAEFLPLLVFSVASVGVFLAFSWPPLLKKAVLTYLLAFILFRIVRTLVGLVLVPANPVAAEGASLHDMSETEARFWHSRISVFAGIFLFGWAVVSLMPALMFTPDVRQLIAYAFGLGLLGTAVEAVWRRPRAVPPRNRLRDGMLTVYLVFLWLLWVLGMTGIMWLGIYVLVLPALVAKAGRAAEGLASTTTVDSLWSVVTRALVGRGARALVILAALAWLVFVLHNTVSLVADDDTIANVTSMVINAIVIVLVADLLWNLAKAYIAYRMDLAEKAISNPDGKARGQRLRTLLPIFRNTLAVFILVVAALTILSSMGIQIGPLIAGAGIFGVAIGFGSQTLVKDVISGIFYMLDDAFRVGEYIQSGSYMGTVEGFSLRSVRLRHHRGPIFTVPFGSLGAVQNMSRDWAIEKLTINVTYDSDVNLAKKLIRQIGQDLAKDPEFEANTIEPLKMQGVDSFGEFAIALKLKLMAKPGTQFTMKRRALMMIKTAFDENGIKIAVPTVKVSGSDDGKAAAAQVAQRRRVARTAKKPA